MDLRSWCGPAIVKYFLADRGMIDCRKSTPSITTGAKPRDLWIAKKCFQVKRHCFFHLNLMPNQGVPNGSRARSILFLRNSLQPKTTAYPSIGQKKLNGASSRLMVYFCAELSAEIQRSHPSDLHRFLDLQCLFMIKCSKYTTSV